MFIGALFDDNVNDTELMLRFAVESINNQQDNHQQRVRIDEMHAEVPYGNEFAASRRLCRFMKVFMRDDMILCHKAVKCKMRQSRCALQL